MQPARRARRVRPATGERLATVADADARRRPRGRQRAFDTRVWGGLRPADRERILLKLADLIEADAETLAQLGNAEPGKSIHVSRAIEVGASVEYVRYMAGWATKITGQTLDVSIPFPPARYTAYTRKEPVGVVAAIVPWNFPLMIAVWKLIPALAAGCDRAEAVAGNGHHRAGCAREAGVPPGVFNVVTGGRVCGAALASHPSIAKISFTKPTATGKLVGAAAVQNMTRFARRRQEPDRDARRRRRRAGARRRRRRRVLQPGCARPHRASMCTAASSGSSRTASRASRSR